MIAVTSQVISLVSAGGTGLSHARVPPRTEDLPVQSGHKQVDVTRDARQPRDHCVRVYPCPRAHRGHQKALRSLPASVVLST